MLCVYIHIQLVHILYMKPAVTTKATFFPDKQEGICYMHFPTDRRAFDGPVVKCNGMIGVDMLLYVEKVTLRSNNRRNKFK